MPYMTSSFTLVVRTEQTGGFLYDLCQLYVIRRPHESAVIVGVTQVCARVAGGLPQGMYPRWVIAIAEWQ